MKSSNGKIPVLSAIAALALVFAFTVEAGNLPENDMASTGQEKASSSTTSQSESDSTKEKKRDAKSGKRKAKTLTEEELEFNWLSVKTSLLNNMTGTSLGGWWRMGETERLVYLSTNPDYRVYAPDNTAQGDYSLIGEGSIDSMDPLFTPIYQDPFGQTKVSETTFAFSDGTHYVWRKDNQGALALSTSGGELFTSELVRMDYASIPFALKMAVARADYGKQSGASPLTEVADATYADGLQVLSGTIRVASESELFSEKSGMEPSELVADTHSSPEIAELVLDSPTFLEGEHASDSSMVIEAVQTIELSGGGTDWLSMDGRYVTIAVSAENVAHPSDVQPCDAWATDVELW